jgi:hypothetical protein
MRGIFTFDISPYRRTLLSRDPSALARMTAT